MMRIHRGDVGLTLTATGDHSAVGDLEQHSHIYQHVWDVPSDKAAQSGRADLRKGRALVRYRRL
jgi:hypothetical protein